MTYRNIFLTGVTLAVALRALVACGDDPAPANPGQLLTGGTAGTGGDSGAGQGGSTGCEPRTCESSGVVCGVLDDGCGSLVMCDSGCGSAGEGGGGNCEPTTCEAEHKDCGRIADGCGAEIECGECDGTTCGSVLPNVCGCPDDEVFDAAPRTATRARSAGFSGSDADYLELYEVSCESVDDCTEACLDRGGEDEMCEASECLEGSGGTRDCLPAPVWSNLQGIQAESESVTDAVELVVVDTPYHDVLLTDSFDLEIPDAADVQGITVEVRRAGDASVSDDSIKLVKGGAVGGAERGGSDPWSPDLEWVSYGGPSDSWGEEWTAEELRAQDFGVALSVTYEDTVGNARAYVDQVRVTVHYTLNCEP